MLAWIHLHTSLLLTVLGALGVLTFVGSLVALPILIARLPEDHFVSERSRSLPWRSQHPTRDTLLRIGRNLLGLMLVLGGLAMLFLPGQGILTIAIGLLLMDLPKKRAFQAWLLSWRPVHRGMNWLRRKANQPEFICAP
ncbi:MAG: PGPGW domain-containing protein [Planctomycetota bacterium]|nr:PGPGW domain-containing protein [Planctomycetota bacterium]